MVGIVARTTTLKLLWKSNDNILSLRGPTIWHVSERASLEPWSYTPCWNFAADGQLTEAAMRKKIEAQGFRVTKYTYPPGTYFPDHTHTVDKIDCVLSGRFRMTIYGQVAVLGPGDWLEVPRGAVHSAEVVGQEAVVSLDATRK